MYALELTKSKPTSGVFCIDGDDLFWKDYALKYFYSLVKEESKEVAIRVYEKLDSLDEVSYLLGSFSFDEETQVLVVADGAYKSDKKEIKAFLELLKEDVSPYIVLLVNVKFLTAAEKKSFTTVDCGKLDRLRLAEFTEKLFPRGGIDRAAVQKLLDYTQFDMARIKTESEKLTAYADGRKVTAEMVEALVCEDFDLQIYQFVNSVCADRRRTAREQLDVLLGRGEPKALILASLIKQYRRLLHSALSPLSDSELAELFGVKEFAVKKCRETKNAGQRVLKSKLDMLVDYEFSIRSGAMSEGIAFDAAMAKLIG